jgi:hypothetical protein
MTPRPDDVAHCYDSSTDVRSSMETGFVHSGDGSLQQWQARVPCVFHSKKKVLYHLKYHIPFSSQPFSWSSVKDCLVVLHDSTGISESAWQGSRYSTPENLGA